MPPPPARPQSRKRKRSRRRRPHAPRDPLESEVAVEYEVGCVLEDLLRCVHAVCDLGVDPDCEPCLVGNPIQYSCTAVQSSYCTNYKLRTTN
jgi:hypothetical protein